MSALPVARLAFPSLRITLAGALAEGRTTIQDVSVKIVVTLGWRNETDRAVTFLVVVPVHKFGDPLAGNA